ncbi:MAG TPA: hypothetical protein ENJ08_05635 [Gammaproteobacteria bacterium]|nr:hypothetical protein [Gammaproteobacteria bacterium]
MNLKNIYLYSICLTLTIISGCTPEAYIEKVTPITPGLSHYETAFVNVKANSREIENEHGYQESRSALQTEFISKLSDAHVFSMVSPQSSDNNENGSVLIDLIIEDMNYLSGTSSIMGGVFSGNAHLRILAKLTEADTGKIIGEIRSGAQTSSSGGMFRGSTSTLISEISTKLTKEISGYK